MAPLLQSEAKFTTIMLDRTSRPMARHMMGFLATPITTGSTRGWPVPDLKELRISRHSNVNLEDVVEMVASRHKGQETRGVDGALIEPALKACPLLRFRSEGNHLFGRRALRRLQGMLGEANVFHEETIQDGDDNNDSDNENDDNGLIYSATWFPGETPETEAQIVV
ncbi:hypothetical protein FRB93_008616 [Tulasnella sp. JGI-2019a]|nr:hypothetical protein FRB93_008616 [Tulasnella sp. JGI-2019a]